MKQESPKALITKKKKRIQIIAVKQIKQKEYIYYQNKKSEWVTSYLHVKVPQHLDS